MQRRLMRVSLLAAKAWLASVVRAMLLCMSLCTLDCSTSIAAGPPTPPIGIALSEIRIARGPDAQSYRAAVLLRASNCTEMRYCLLPSESWVWYWIDYDNGESNFAFSRSATVGTPAPKEISDIKVRTIIIEPGGVADVRVDLVVEAPKGTKGRLSLSYQCKPSYAGKTYRGIPICLDTLSTELDIVAVPVPLSTEIVIRGAEVKKASQSEKRASGKTARRKKSEKKRKKVFSDGLSFGQ